MNIEKYLVLNKYLMTLFGVNDFKDLQKELENTLVGTDSDGRTYFVNKLRSLENRKISEDALLGYDANIQSYIRKINYRREPVTLKYFQYLATLFTEIVLDNLKNRKPAFLYELNEFLGNYKQEQEIDLIFPSVRGVSEGRGVLPSVRGVSEGRGVLPSVRGVSANTPSNLRFDTPLTKGNADGVFTQDDLRKLAFWMATGSGKTLIAHINYHQFFNYKPFSPDNIIFITPNEGLSKQHFEELQKSGIPARLYGGSLNGGFKNEGEVLVIEMTKFVEEKKGGGVTLPVDVFEGRNLVFVDEGHKGRRSEEQKWARLRNKLAQKGFVFEYSATFGQILNEQNKETLEEYAKSILFDYSYKYFYLDGYGKDFSVLNVKQAKISEQEFQESMFVANLLSFYEQILIFEENKKEALEHNLEKPLWIFVGTTVTGKEEESDVIQIVEFIKKVICDEEWVRKWSERILNGKTKLKDENGKDAFEDRFKYLRGRGIDFEDLYKRVFGGKGSLRVSELKHVEGELGLKIGESKYFGVISIGNVSGFKKQLERTPRPSDTPLQEGKGIYIEQDAISGSLFDDIKKEGSPINLLIGSKKFIEGWDTWRVSSMGLLNIGRGQGPQIIQLFGRGVRLKGKGMSLKRSDDTPRPSDTPLKERTPLTPLKEGNFLLRFLETLNIYGIKADYLSKFLEAIRKEEVEFETIEIPVKPQHKEKWKTLYILSKDENKRYEEEEILRLDIDDRIYFTIDLLPKVSIYLAKERKEDGIKIDEIKAEFEELRFTEDIVDLLDWERMWQEICDFKILKGYWNLVLDRNVLKNLLLSDRYKIMALPEILEVKGEYDIRRVEDIALFVIKKYVELFYRKYARRFETENLQYETVGKQLPLFVFEKPGNQYSYTVQVDKREKGLIKEIKNLTRDLNKLLKEDTAALPRIYFDNHLYVPILLQGKKINKISPTGLVESEQKFVLDLREYLKGSKNEFSVEVYLLRNHPFSGVGFQLQWSKFYPDFIMWTKNGKKQTIVFIDPKGLEHTKGLDDEKIQFAKKEIKQIQQRLGKANIRLESFILSQTSYDKLIEGRTSPPSKDKYLDHHVLFLEDKDWPERLFKYVYRMNSFD